MKKVIVGLSIVFVTVVFCLGGFILFSFKNQMESEKVFDTEDKAIQYAELLIGNEFENINLDQYKPNIEYEKKTEIWTIWYMKNDESMHVGGGAPYATFGTDGTVYKVLLQK